MKVQVNSLKGKSEEKRLDEMSDACLKAGHGLLDSRART